MTGHRHHRPDIIDVTNGHGAVYVQPAAVHFQVTTTRRADGTYRVRIRRAVQL